jgi:hypothetical protein
MKDLKKMCGPEGWIHLDDEVECDFCKKRTKKILNLKATGAYLCSLWCERGYWFDILY